MVGPTLACSAVCWRLGRGRHILRSGLGVSAGTGVEDNSCQGIATFAIGTRVQLVAFVFLYTAQIASSRGSRTADLVARVLARRLRMSPLVHVFVFRLSRRATAASSCRRAAGFLSVSRSSRCVIVRAVCGDPKLVTCQAAPQSSHAFALHPPRPRNLHVRSPQDPPLWLLWLGWPRGSTTPLFQGVNGWEQHPATRPTHPGIHCRHFEHPVDNLTSIGPSLGPSRLTTLPTPSTAAPGLTRPPRPSKALYSCNTRLPAARWASSSTPLHRPVLPAAPVPVTDGTLTRTSSPSPCATWAPQKDGFIVRLANASAGYRYHRIELCSPNRIIG